MGNLARKIASTIKPQKYDAINALRELSPEEINLIKTLRLDKPEELSRYILNSLYAPIISANEKLDKLIEWNLNDSIQMILSARKILRIKDKNQIDIALRDLDVGLNKTIEKTRGIVEKIIYYADIAKKASNNDRKAKLKVATHSFFSPISKKIIFSNVLARKAVEVIVLGNTIKRFAVSKGYCETNYFDSDYSFEDFMSATLNSRNIIVLNDYDPDPKKNEFWLGVRKCLTVNEFNENEFAEDWDDIQI